MYPSDIVWRSVILGNPFLNKRPYCPDITDTIPTFSDSTAAVLDLQRYFRYNTTITIIATTPTNAMIMIGKIGLGVPASSPIAIFNTKLS